MYFSDVLGSLRISELLHIVSVRNCNGIIISGIRVEPVGIGIPVTSVGNTLSVVSVLFIFGFKVTEVVVFEVGNQY